MSLLLETIKIRDSEYQNLEYHTARMNRSRKILLACRDEIDLNKILPKPYFPVKGIYKCRILYDHKVDRIEIHRYRKNIPGSIKIVESSGIDYSHKYANRKPIDDLKNSVEEDDILMVVNGFIGDTSYANIIFRDGKKWFTPSTPLLRGTMREKLLKENKIIERSITIKDLRKYEEARLINAMIEIEDCVSIPIENFK